MIHTSMRTARPAADSRETKLRPLNVAIVALLATGIGYLLSLTPADSDLWGHVRFGQLIRATGGVPRTDPFSFLGGTWVNHEWLSEVVLSLGWDLGGSAGLLIIKLTIGALLAACVFRFLLAKGLDALRGGLLTVFLILLMLPGLAPVRPQLFSYLLFLLLLLMLEAAERGRGAWLWGLPALFAVWANLHGGFLAGLGILGLWTGVHLMTRENAGSSGFSRSRRSEPGRWLLLGVLAACLVATFLNPFGFQLITFLVRTATVARPEIVEWRPLRLATGAGVGYLALVALLIASLTRGPRTKPALLLPLGVTAFLPLLASRHLPLFALSAAVLGGESLARLASRPHGAAGRPHRGTLQPDRRLSGVERTVYGVVLVLLAGLAALTVARSLRGLGCVAMAPGAGGVRYPARAVKVLKEAEVKGRLLVPFNWGEYAIWHLAPELQVSMDGRRETVYPERTYMAYQTFMNGTGDWSKQLERLDPDVALVPAGSSVFNLLALEPGWSLAYEDSVAAVFSPARTQFADRIERATRTMAGQAVENRCFP